MEVIDVLRKLGIELTIDNWFSVNGELKSSSFDSSQLRGSCFDFGGKKILHFTSLESSRLITTSRYLRGSNMNNLDDPFEVIHGLNIINKNLSKSWEKIKDNSFVICFTELKNEDVKGHYKYHWENYANNYKGVAFEFEITENYKPYNIYPLKVLYVNNGDNRIATLNDVKDTITTLAEAEKEFILPILASIKSKKYEDEAEVRIFHNIAEPSIEHLSNNNENEEVFYSFNNCNKLSLEMRIPFFGLNEKGDEFLKLNKIYLGNKVLNSNDNISSSIILDHFKNIQEIGLAEIEW